MPADPPFCHADGCGPLLGEAARPPTFRRVLMISSLFPPAHESGYELVCDATARALADEGVEVRILTTGREGDCRVGLGHNGLTVARCLQPLPRSSPGSLAVTFGNLRAVAGQVRRFRPDWVCVWSVALTGPLPVLPALAANLPVTMAVLDYRIRDLLAARLLRRPEVDPGEPSHTLLERVGARLLRLDRRHVRFAFPSEHLRAAYRGLKIAEDRMAVFPEPCRVARSQGTPEPRTRDVLFCGRLVEGKGVIDLVRAYSLASQREPGTPGWLALLGAGDPAFLRRVVETAGELGVAERVRFLGMVDLEGVISALDAAGVLVVPSLWDDPAPLTVLEGQARRCPVVAYLSGGIPEQVRDGETGILVPKGDVEALAAAILRVLTEPELAARLGQRAAEEVAPRHAPAVAVQTLVMTAGIPPRRPRRGSRSHMLR